MRKTFQELNDIKKELDVDKLWSWSRINAFQTSKYEYFLKYIKREKELNSNSAYLMLGNVAHETLEAFYCDKCTYEDMKSRFETLWATTVDLMDLKFDRNDADKNNNIKNKYYENMKLFFLNHIPIKFDTKLEEFVLTKFDEKTYVQGYIDCMFIDENKELNIIDFKTSTIYKGDKIDNEEGQLILYAIAMNQKGVPFDKIKVAWNFLKYVNVQITLKNKKTKVRQILRSELGESLKSNLSMWMKVYGYTDKDIEEVIVNLCQTNNPSCIPKDVSKNFEFDDCYVYVELSEEKIEKWKNIVCFRTSCIDNLVETYSKTNNEKIFWEDDDSLKKNSYYYANLSGYTIKQNKNLEDYLNRIQNDKENNLFSTSKNDSALDWINNL